MSAIQQTTSGPKIKRRRPLRVPMSVIGQWARKIATRFQPDRIILFGSHAYGKPHPDSDVDILVIMPGANEINQSIRLTLAFEHAFPLDLIVRTPAHLRKGLEEGDWFLREIVSHGKVLYEKDDPAVGKQSRGRRARSKKASVREAAS